MSYVKKRKSKKSGSIVPEIISDERTFAEWITEHSKALIYGGGAILLVLVIVLGFFWMKSYREKAASEDMDFAVKLYWNTIANQPTDDPEADKLALEQSLKTFKEISENYGSKLEGREASVYGSRILYKLGRYDEAVQLLEKVRSSDLGFASEVNALYLLGKCYEASGELQKAIDVYSQMNDASTGEIKAVLMADIARCSELTGDVDRAISLYKEIIKDYPDSDLAMRSSKKLVTLGVLTREET